MKHFKRIIEPHYVYISTIVTVITGAITTILNACANESVFFHVFLGTFLFGISAVLMQVLVATCIIKESMENEAKDKIGVLLPIQATFVQSELEKLLSSHNNKIKKIRIICYGTSGYGELLKNIHKDNYPNAEKITLDMMVCSPDNVFKNSVNDKMKIESLVTQFNNTKNINIYYAKFLPTIRGCVVYDKKDRPIWSCLQTYSYGDRPISSAEYDDFYALVGNGDNEYLLINNEKIISKEFDRLKA